MKICVLEMECSDKESKINTCICNNNEIYYAGYDCETVPEDLLKYGNIVKKLDLSYNKIRYIDCIQRFSDLEELFLDNNEISDQATFPVLNKLHTLTLNKNKIRDLDHFLDTVSNSFPSLTHLSLLGNDACPDYLTCQENDEDDYKRYRLRVIWRLPKLKFLDVSEVTNIEKLEAKNQGPYLLIVRPPVNLESESSTSGEDLRGASYSPLPNQVRDSSQALFGKCKYIYYGKHSEGNRFIRNNDL